KRLRLDPADATAAPSVLEALANADALVLGPGSLYTSLLAILVVPGVIDAITRSPAIRIFVCNAMTEPGETDGYGVADHLRALAASGRRVRLAGDRAGTVADVRRRPSRRAGRPGPRPGPGYEDRSLRQPVRRAAMR